MGLLLIAGPSALAEPPVTCFDVGDYLRIGDPGNDLRLLRLITETWQSIDGPRTPLGRCIMAQTWELLLDAFPVCEITLPTAPVQSIVHIKYDDDGEHTLDPNDYYLDAATELPRIIPGDGGWPQSTGPNFVRIRFVAGYASADLVPAPIKRAITLMVEQSYDGTDLSAEIAALLAPFRLFR